jgi:hypothetical protein
MAFTIQEEVRREVARCVSEKAILRIAPVATRITADHMGAGISVNAIASMLLEAGISAAVPIEIETPDHAAKATAGVLR